MGSISGTILSNSNMTVVEVITGTEALAVTVAVAAAETCEVPGAEAVPFEECVSWL